MPTAATVSNPHHVTVHVAVAVESSTEPMMRGVLSSAVMFVSTLLLATLSLLAGQAQRPEIGTEVVLEGTIMAADRLAWLERGLEVPAGTARIDVETSFTERDRGTALEFGVCDPACALSAPSVPSVATLIVPDSVYKDAHI